MMLFFILSSTQCSIFVNFTSSEKKAFGIKVVPISKVFGCALTKIKSLNTDVSRVESHK